MKRILFTTGFGTAAFLISTAYVPAQSPVMMPPNPMAAQEQKAPNASEMQTYAPSDVAALSSGVPADRAQRRRQGDRFAASAGAGKTPVQGGPGIPHLCFEPGVGWTAVPASALGANETAADQGTDANKPAANSPSALRQRLIAGETSPKGIECPPLQLKEAATTGTQKDDFGNGLTGQTDNPSLTPNAEYGSYSSFPTSDSTAGMQPGAHGQSSFELPPGLGNNGLGNAPSPATSLDELKALKRRAYVSPIKLRELSRNAQDLETRLELRRMDAEAEKQKIRRTAGEGTGAGARASGQHKPVSSRDLAAIKAECARKADTSKTRVCSRLQY